jgi:CheY-like chemotaxis protein
MPCIVLTDLNMPGMNGIELTSWIRAHPALKQLAVVIISSSTAPVDEEHARTAGADGFLSKYPSSEALRTLVNSLPCGPV